MPGQLFTDAERRRLGGFPAQLSHEDLVTFYTLTRADRALVNQYADETSRLGFALQLGTLRYLGFCPDDLGSAPSEVVRFLADQLKLAPGALSAYGRRADPHRPLPRRPGPPGVPQGGARGAGAVGPVAARPGPGARPPPAALATGV